MKAWGYFALSFAAATVVVWHAFATREQYVLYYMTNHVLLTMRRQDKGGTDRPWRFA
jgi:hypothetical protein